MLRVPAHACFIIRSSRARGPRDWSATSFARALGAKLLALDTDEAGGAAHERLAKRLVLALADGQTVAVETRGMRKEDVGHLRNLAKRAYFTPVDIDPARDAPADGEPLEVKRVFPACFRPWLRGPFDIIADVHDCAEELRILLEKLGYGVAPGETPIVRPHPKGRRLVFVGDFTDRGPAPVATLRLVLAARRSGALAVAGNHDKRLRDFLEGRHVSDKDWFSETARAIRALAADEQSAIARFLADLPRFRTY